MLVHDKFDPSPESRKKVPKFVAGGLARCHMIAGLIFGVNFGAFAWYGWTPVFFWTGGELWGFLVVRLGSTDASRNGV